MPPTKRVRKLGKHFSRKRRRLSQQQTNSTNQTQTQTHTQPPSKTITATTTTTSNKKRRPKRKKPSPPEQQQQQQKPVQEDDDPDKQNVKRLEKLLGVSRKKRQRINAAASPAASPKTQDFSYSQVFHEGDDDLVELLDFCDNRAKDTYKHKAASDSSQDVTVVKTSTKSEDQSPVVEDDDSDDNNRQQARENNSDESDYENEEEEEEEEDDDDDDDHSDGNESILDDEGDVDSDTGEITEESSPPLKSKATKLINGDSDVDDDEGEVQPTSNQHSNMNSNSNSNRNNNSNKKSTTNTEQAKRDSSNGNQSKRYVPPGARQRNGVTSDALKRRLRGLLNRVADVNASGIADSIVDIFQTSTGMSRRELAEIYANGAVDASRDGSGIGQVNPYVQSHAAIASHLGNKVDGVVLATVIVVAVRRSMNVLYDGDGFDTNNEEEQNENQDNDVFGYIALLCGIFTKGGLSSFFIYDLIKKIAENLNTLRLEILLSILRDIGAVLRSTDPIGLKEVIEFIHERARSLHDSKQDDDNQDKKNNNKNNNEDNSNNNNNDGEKISQMKLTVMLDLINDIKNNRVKKSIIKKEELRFEWATKPSEPLNASINDLLDDDFVSLRWWDDTKGLTLAERRGNGNQNPNSKSKQIHEQQNEKTIQVEINEGPDLTLLATSLRLNTEYRRALFRSMMGAANLQDAIERIEVLNGFDLKNGHDKDTALVILHCCAAERSFNPFYSALADHFCRRARRLRFTFEFALWDIFKTVPQTNTQKLMSLRKRRHYANLLSRLWKSSTLSLSVLRKMPVDFENGMQTEEREFYIDAISRALRLIAKDSQSQSKSQTSDIKLSLFQKLAAESWDGSDDFRLSLAAFIRRYVANDLSKEEKSLAVKGADILERGQ